LVEMFDDGQALERFERLGVVEGTEEGVEALSQLVIRGEVDLLTAASVRVPFMH